MATLPNRKPASHASPAPTPTPTAPHGLNKESPIYCSKEKKKNLELPIFAKGRRDSQRFSPLGWRPHKPHSVTGLPWPTGARGPVEHATGRPTDIPGPQQSTSPRVGCSGSTRPPGAPRLHGSTSAPSTGSHGQKPERDATRLRGGAGQGRRSRAGQGKPWWRRPRDGSCPCSRWRRRSRPCSSTARPSPRSPGLYSILTAISVCFSFHVSLLCSISLCPRRIESVAAAA